MASLAAGQLVEAIPAEATEGATGFKTLAVTSGELRDGTLPATAVAGAVTLASDALVAFSGIVEVPVLRIHLHCIVAIREELNQIWLASDSGCGSEQAASLRDGCS
jgi:hypothetical protein